MAVYEMGISENDFLEMSFRQLNILIDLNRNHRIGILNQVAVNILSPSEEDKTETVEIDSFSEIF